MTRRKWCGLVVAGTFLAYLPALRNGWLGDWDDGMYLLDNPHYRGLGSAQLRWMFSSFLGGHFMPLTWLSYACDYRLWGMNSAGYHAASAALHALGAGLLFLMARELLALDAGVKPDFVDPEAAFAALFFSLSPLRVEPVAWAADRRDVLAGLFYVLTVLAYLRAQRKPASYAAWLAAAAGAFALSLLSKAMGITLPIVLLVLDWHPLRRLGPAALLEKIPFFLLSLGAVAIGGPARPWGKYAPLERLAQAAYGLSFYVGKSVVPFGLSPIYEIPPAWNLGEPRWLLSAALVVLLSAAVWRLRRKAPGALAVWLCYGAAAAPTLGLYLTGYQLVADRYSYLPCLGLSVAAGAVLRRARARIPCAGAAAGCWLVLLGALSWRQVLVWRDSQSLWTQALSVEPYSSVAHNNMGTLLVRQGRVEEAVGHFETALAVNPACVDAVDRLLKVQNDPSRSREAAELRETIEVNPVCRSAKVNLVTARASLGRDLEDAAVFYGKLAALGVASAGLYDNLGAAFAAQGKAGEARRAYLRALAIDPGDARARGAIARISGKIKVP
ncbi:MAG: tetratricopeptide repeat protein [Elusimicrobia bacterium]|nr:tetratricopeptide repeat protein [Elusimicrobiota bacterium]